MTKNKKNIMWIIITTFIFSITLLLTTKLTATLGDNQFLSFIAQGVFDSSQSKYLIFPDIIFGMFVSLFSSSFPTANWMTIIQLCISLVCFVFFGYVITFLFPSWKGKVLYIFFLLLFGKYHFIYFEFTQNAYLYCAGGIFGIIVFLTLKEKSSHLLWLTVSLVLIWTGCGIRSDCLLAVIPFAGILILVLHIEKKVIGKETLIICIVLGTGLIFFQLINMAAYSQPDWKMYKKYNENRAKILDYGTPNYDIYQQVYIENNLSQNDYELLDNWVFNDLNVFSPEVMKNLAELNRVPIGAGLNKYAIWDTAYDLYMEISTGGVACAVFLSLLIFLWTLPWKAWWKMIPIIVLIYTEYWYLNCQGRMPFRSTYGIWLMAFLTILIFIYSSLSKYIMTSHKQKIIVIIGIALGVYVSVQQYSSIKFEWGQNWKTDREHFMDEVIAFAQQNKDKLFVLDFSASAGEYSLFKVLEKDSFSNIYFLGTWLAPSPLNENKLSNFDISNVMSAVSEGKTIYLVDYEKIDYIIAFLKEHYNVDAVYELYHETLLLPIYALHL